MDIIGGLLSDPARPRLTTYTESGRMELSAATLANWQSKVAYLLLSVGVQPGDTVAIQAACGWQPAVIAIGAWKIGARITDLRGAEGDSADQGVPSVLFTDDMQCAEESDCEEVFVLSTDPFGRGVEESGGSVPFGVNDFSPEVRVQPDVFAAGAYPGLVFPGTFTPPASVAEAQIMRQMLTQADSELEYIAEYAAQYSAELVPGVSIFSLFLRLLEALDRGAQDARSLQDTQSAELRILTGAWDSAESLARVLSPLLLGGSVVLSTDLGTARAAQLCELENALLLPL